MKLRTSKVNGDRRSQRHAPIVNRNIVIPVAVALAGIVARGIGRLMRLLGRHPLATAVAIGLLVVRVRYGTFGFTVLLGAVASLLLVLRLAYPPEFWWLVRWVHGHGRLAWLYRRRWHVTMVQTDLATRIPTSLGERVTYTEYLPRIRRIRSTGAVDHLRVELLYGQQPDDFAEQAEELRHAFRALRCAVRADGPGFVWLDFYRTDPLVQPVPPIADDTAGLPDLTRLPLGRREDGRTWLLHLLGTHLLVAGSTGAGKGSVLWSLIRALRWHVAAGVAQLWVIDPKGGMELAFGRPMFTRFADTDPAQIADVLDEAVTVMRDRARRLKGVVRLHEPTRDEPLIVVVVDEVAALTAYLADRDLKRRIAAALSLLLSQGRAVGVTVVAALQDPRKEVLPFRDLFPTRIALRLAEADQVDLVLGHGARDRGAPADSIPVGLPGVGYVLLDGQPEPTRVRASWISDDDIADMGARWPAGHSWPAVDDPDGTPGAEAA